MKRDMPPIHPGEILLEDFLKPLGITQYKLAKSVGVPQRRIGEIVAGERAIMADTALRLAKFFGTDAQSWVNLQARLIMIWKLLETGSRTGWKGKLRQ